jgi:hypothetical protein
MAVEASATDSVHSSLMLWNRQKEIERKKEEPAW